MSHQDLRLANALRELNEFTTEQWTRWVGALIEGVHYEPAVNLGFATPDRELVWLYEHGLSSTVTFTEGLGRVFESSSPARPAQLFYLLQAISVIRPPVCKELLARQLRERRFLGAFYMEHDLESLALACRSRYGIDQEFAKWVGRSMLDDKRSFSYKLTCLRVLTDYDPDEGCRYLGLVLPFIEAHTEKRILGGFLRGFIWSAESAEPLFKWFLDAQLSMRRSELLALEEVLRTWVVPWKPSRLATDPYALLLSASVFAGVRPFVAEELLLVARCITRRPEVDHEHVRRVLRMVWDHSLARLREWCIREPFPGDWGSCMPWYGPESAGGLYTEWNSECISQDVERQLFQQTCPTEEESDAVVEVLLAAVRPTPVQQDLTSEGLSFREEFELKLALEEARGE